MVCKLVITDGVAGAFNNDGSPSSLYQEALDYYGNQESAISVWNTSNSDEYLNAVGKTSEESTLEDVLGFASNFDISTTKLSEQELKECIQFMIQNNIESLEDLTTKMVSLFKEKGYFEVSTRKLVKSGLYTQQEAESIDSGKILNFLNKLESTSLNIEVTQAPELNPSKFDIRLKSGEKTVFGTFKKLAITDVVDFVVKNTNSKEYNDILAVLSNSELFSNVVNVMEESTSAREYIMSEITSKTSIPRAFIGLDGSITDVDISEEIKLKNLLLSNINPIELLADVEFLNSISNLVWNTRNGQIKNVLKGVERSLIKFNVDVIGVSEIAKDNKETVMVLLESAYNMLENPTPENMSQFASVKREIFGNDNSRAVINEDSKLNGLTTYHIETELTPGQMFDDYGMLKIGDNIYHKVSINTQEAYSQLYNMLIDGSLTIPQNLFTTDSPMAPENFESTMVSLSNFINSRETGVESINNEQVSIAQVLFGYGNLNVENILPNSTLENEDYLRTEFVSDFYEYVLEEKIKGSDVYDKVLKHFNVSDTDLNLNTAITPNISGIKYEKELRDYASIKREGQIKELQTSVVEDVELDTLYMNKPNLVREVGGNFVQNGEYLVKAPSYDLYTRVGDTLYRKVVTTEDKDVYREVNTNRDGTYFQTNFNFETSSAEAQKIAKDTILYKQVTPTAKAVADNIKQSTVTKKSELKSILDQLMKTNLAKGYEIMSSEEIRNKLIELGVDADVAFQISAWHGSPHKFDRFSTEFMGTGEGAQAFGWGLYFTELEGIARNYATTLSDIDIYSNGKKLTGIHPLMGFEHILKNADGGIDGLKEYLEESIVDYEKADIDKRVKSLKVKQYNKVLNYINKNNITFNTNKNQNLYNISLHKGKQPSDYYYIEWDKSKSEYKGIVSNFIKELIKRYPNSRQELENKLTESNFRDYSDISGQVLYQNTLKSAYRVVKSNANDKDISLLLLDIGVDGMKYPAESISRGATSDTARGFNYVVFDENAITVEEVIQFQQNGITLLPNGFYHNGKVYINQDTANLDTSIHEFSHAYNQLLKNERPEFYKEGLNLIEKEGKQYIDFVKKNQPNLQGEALLEEALAQAVGDAGAKLIEAEKSTGLKQWLQNAWNKIKEMLGLSSYTIEQVRNMSLQEYTNAVATDLLRGEEVNFKTPSEEYFERNADRLPLTLAVFNRPEFKAMQGKMVNPITVLNSLNQSGIKQIEKDLIKQIIQDNYQGQKKISYDELEATVRANIMPLERIFTSSYADYGMGNLGDGNYGEANTIILNSPIEHGVTGHFSGDFKASGRKNIKYVPKQLNDNTWVAVEEGYESQANDNNIYQYVGTAGTKEAVEGWIVKYDLSQGKIFDNKKYLVYQDAFDQKDNVIPVEGFDTEQEAKNFIEKNKDNFSYTLDHVDENHIREKWNLEDTNKGMFGHIRVWQDGRTFYVSELQSDYFQKNNARKEIFNTPSKIELIGDELLKEKKEERSNLEKEVEKIIEEIDPFKVLDEAVNKGYDLEARVDDTLISIDGKRILAVSKTSFQPYMDVVLNNYFSRDLDAKYKKIKQNRARIDEINRYPLTNKFKEDNKKYIEKRLNELLTPQEKQFIASQKEWEKRMVREAIKEASLSGATSLRFPTPYTLSVIEGYLSEGAPYEIENANDSTYLVAGDRIYYAEEDHTVVDSDNTTITIAESGRVQSAEEQDIISQEVDYAVDNDMYEIENNLKDFYTQEEWNDFRDNYSPISSTELDEVGNEIEEGVFEVSEGKIRDIVSEYYNNIFTDAESIIKDMYGNDVWVSGNTVTWTDGTANIETLMQPSEYRGQGTKDNFSIEDDLDDTQQTVARKYEEIAQILKAERGDNFEIVTDDNGFDWYETKLATEEVNNPVIAFQVISSETNDIRYQIQPLNTAINDILETYPESELQYIAEVLNITTPTIQELLEAGEVTYQNEDGQPCAKVGVKSKFEKGHSWKVVKTIEGNSHERGGVDIELSDKGIKVKRNNSEIKAENGLVIKATR